jgi:hypothetical protein
VFQIDFGDDTTLDALLSDPNSQLQCGDTGQPDCSALAFEGFPDTAQVAEPASLALLGTGLLLLGWRRCGLAAD